jgi:hypothetical protein
VTVSLPDNESLVSLVNQGRWLDLISATNRLGEQQSPLPEHYFFRGMGLTKAGHPSEALDLIRAGLALAPQSEWGNKLLFDALRTLGDYHQAFDTFAAFIRTPGNRENEKAWYVQCAAELNLFDLASTMNETRNVVLNVPRLPGFALAVQCFCKVDTLEKLFQSLLGLKDAKQYSLLILQDNPTGSTKSENYAPKCEQVKALISTWHSLLASHFFSIEYLINERNLGTAATCRRLLDIVASRYRGFLFVEDDCILAPSALEWATHHLTNSITEDAIWFFTCESSYFDKEGRHLSEHLKSRLETLAQHPALKDAFVLYDFVPSTCFGTTSEIWNRCAKVRSFTRGPESLNRFLIHHQRKTVGPVVPRASDIGMLHELGYSVQNVGLGNVREKNTFCMAQTAFVASNCTPYPADKDLLFRAASKLDPVAIATLEELIL